MKDGYYLSVYTHIGEIAHLYDIGLRHDHNMSLWRKNGNSLEIVRYWEFERLSGFKGHEKSFYNLDHARSVIAGLLAPHGLRLSDLNAIWGTPGLTTTTDHDWERDYSAFSYHSLSHLFSSLLLDSDLFYRERIIALAVDAAPDKVIDTKAQDKPYFVGAFSDRGHLEVFPVPSPAVLWTLMRARYRLREGALMALGSASRSEACIDPGEPPPMSTMEDMNNLGGWFDDLAARVERLSAEDRDAPFNGFDTRFSDQDNKISMLVKVILKMSFRVMEQTVDAVLDRYSVDPGTAVLALSGGFALSCPTNSHLMQKYGFKGFVGPPCINDSGISLGMALHKFHSALPRVQFNLGSAFHGCRDESLDCVAANPAFAPHIDRIEPMNVETAVDDLMSAPIVWFQGRAEIGPRALGARSLLADPGTPTSRDVLNAIKQRQWWRPVAPVVLAEDVEAWFENAYQSPFMLHTFVVRPEHRMKVPAICHMDQSARVQTVSSGDNPALFDLLSAFKAHTGIPMLCNTSLNDRGEPIIDKIEEALNFALRKKMTVAYVNGYRVRLKAFAAYREALPFPRTAANDFRHWETDTAERIRTLNPARLSRYDLMIYCHTPALHRHDPSDPEDAVVLHRRIALLKARSGHKTGLRLLRMWHSIENGEERRS